MGAYRRRVLFVTACICFPLFLSGQERKYPTPLERRIRCALTTLPHYSVFDFLAFRLEERRVILMGAVTLASMKENAERAVGRVSEISKIVNRIEELPVSPDDDLLRMSIYRAIYHHPSFTRYAVRAVSPIHIVVLDGNVRLEGTVSSAADKTVAQERAAGVEGAGSVTNNLEVESL